MDKKISVAAGSLIVVSGAPGAGKSFLKKKIEGYVDADSTWLSMDAIRLSFLGEIPCVTPSGKAAYSLPQYSSHAVWAVLTNAIEARLSQGLTCIVEGLFLTDKSRAPLAAIAKKFNAPFKVLILDTPLTDCLEGNESRRYYVPATVIERSHASLERTSTFEHEVIDRNTALVNEHPRLTGDAWDVVGDVHGLYTDFIKLVAKVGWELKNGCLHHAKGRKLLLLGDLVDRGPDSVALLRVLRATVAAGNAKVVMGNHDQKLMHTYNKLVTGEDVTLRSRANSDTVMDLLKANDGRALANFIATFKPYYLYEGHGLKLAFIHANVGTFLPGVTASDDCIYGSFTKSPRGLDCDGLYQQGYDLGVSSWTVFHGHIPQTSAQANVFSLEKQAFQNGQLVLMQLDKFIEQVKAGATNKEAFFTSTIELDVDYDFEAVKTKYSLINNLDRLAADGLVTVQSDATKALRVYKYSKRTFWDNLWESSPYLAKARGLVLDLGGNIVSHPFDKVFNYGENGTGLTLPDTLSVIAVAKENGFLGIVSAHPTKRGELLAHTQGSFQSEFVDYLNEYLKLPTIRANVSKFLAKNAVTLLFEVIHPSDPHIIEYGEAGHGLWLIGVRGTTPDALPWPEHEVDKVGRALGLKRPAWKETTLGAVRAEVKLTKTEGFMLRHATPAQEFILKWKSPFYLTTKFMSRMSPNKLKLMYANPKVFKQQVDEEFYPLVDALLEAQTLESMMAKSEGERLELVREQILKICG